MIEDAAYRELRYYGDDVPSLLAIEENDGDGERVIHAGTFSKPYSPGIRVGWGILPRKLVEPLLAQKGNVDFGSPHFNQVLMAAAMERGLFDRHVAALRESYRRKLDATLQAAEEHLRPLGVQWIPARRRAVRMARAPGGDRYGRRRPLVPPCRGRGDALRARRVLLSAGRLSAAAQHAAAELRRALDRGHPTRNQNTRGCD